MSLLPVVPLPRKWESSERTFLVRGPRLQGMDLSLSPRARDRCAGMTLLELVTAVAIFSLVAAAAYAALSQGLVVQDRLQEQRRFWQRLETVFNLIHTDFEQTVDLAPRGPGRNRFNGHEYGNSAAYENMLEFTRNVNTDTHAGPASPFQRVGYRLDDGGLYRRTWSRLDQPYGVASLDSLLIEGISDIRLRYLAHAGLWLTRWPQPMNIEEPPSLPRAVEMTIELEDGGAHRWLFHVGSSR